MEITVKTELEIEVLNATVIEDDTRGRCVEANIRIDYNGCHKTFDFFEYVNEENEIDQSSESAHMHEEGTEYIEFVRLFETEELHEKICELVQKEINNN